MWFRNGADLSIQNTGFNLKERLNTITKWKKNLYIKKLMR